jgi:hypothetical protein
LPAWKDHLASNHMNGKVVNQPVHKIWITSKFLYPSQFVA